MTAAATMWVLAAAVASAVIPTAGQPQTARIVATGLSLPASVPSAEQPQAVRIVAMGLSPSTSVPSAEQPQAVRIAAMGLSPPASVLPKAEQPQAGQPQTAARLIATVQQPRPTGYFVGDLLTQRVLLQNGGRDLNPVTLPTPGRVSSWFERHKMTLETDSASRHWLAIQYQILNAPPKLIAVTLPAWTLMVKNPSGGANQRLTIPSASLNVAPLSPPGSPSQVGVADLRPDRLAPLIELTPIWRAIALSGGALVLTLAAWLGWFIWRNARATATQPFAHALRELQPLDDHEPRAWQILHRAFDRTAGRVIQNATLPDLFERAPHLNPMREQIEQFFAQSRVLFFGAPAPRSGPAASPGLSAPAVPPIPAALSTPAALSAPAVPPIPAALSTPAVPSGTISANPAVVISPRTLCEALRHIERHHER